jgi:hypothetical protein
VILALSFVTPEGFGDALCSGTLDNHKHLGLGRWQHEFKIGPSKGIGLLFELTPVGNSCTSSKISGT